MGMLPPGRSRRLFCTASVALLCTTASRGVDSTLVATPEALERAFRDVTRAVTPSVVALRVERRCAAPGSEGIPVSGPAEQVVIVNGAGMVIDPSGLIATNEHVVQAAQSIEVVFHDGDRRRGELLASDPRSDLAVLRVARTDLLPVTLCDWASVERGQWAVVVGNPYGLGADGYASLAIGIISNLGRRLPGLGELDDRFYGNMIQTTAAINPGNSGGPLFDLHGRVVGIVTAMHVRAGQGDGIGFAIPMSPWKRSLLQRLARGEVIEHGYMHASVRDSLPGERRAAGKDHGVVVVQLDPDADTPLREGDLISELDGQPLVSVSVAAEVIACAPVGSQVTACVTRNGRSMNVRVPIDRRNVSRVQAFRRASRADSATRAGP